MPARNDRQVKPTFLNNFFGYWNHHLLGNIHRNRYVLYHRNMLDYVDRLMNDVDVVLLVVVSVVSVVRVGRHTDEEQGE